MLNQIDSALYYPTIEFQSDTWLKTSLLFWDKIYRIVPRGITPNDSLVVRKAQDEDIIRSIILEKDDLSQAATRFISFTQNLPFIPSGLEDSNNQIQIHKDKIDDRLYPLLESLSTGINSEGWLELPKKLARGYMLFLAKSVSSRRNLATISDNRDIWAITPYFKDKGNFSERVYNPTASGFYSSLIFTDIIPSEVEHIEIEQILKFVKTRKDERSLLRETLQDFSVNLQNCSSESQFSNLIHDFESDIENKKKDYRRSMGFLNDEFCHSLLTVGLPISLAIFSLISQRTDPYNLGCLVPSVFVGAVASYKDFGRKRNQISKVSDVSYLVDIDKELIRNKSIPNYHRFFEEFIND
jgi:hypothetical protein